MRAPALIIVLAFLPFSVFASCNPSGLTAVYVNGILTDYSRAKKDLDSLQTEYIKRTGDYSANFINGYNESHLTGLADLSQSIAQTFNTSITDYDRDTILTQIHPQVNTQKILLVGHSQGTFYTNEIYQYLLEHGVREGSVAVYNLATPASYVAGGGSYKTSTNDKAINAIRDYNKRFDTQLALPGNIDIPLPFGEEDEGWGGHHFSTSYLEAAPDIIIGDIAQALQKLKPIAGTARDGCFEPPVLSLGYNLQKIGFAIADPASIAIKEGGTQVKDSALAVTSTIRQGLANTAQAIGDFVSNFLNPPISVVNKSLVSAAAAAVEPATQAVEELAAEEPVSQLVLGNTPQSETEEVPLAIVPSISVPPPVITPAIQEQSQESPAPKLFSMIPGFGGGGGASNAPASSDQAAQPPPVPIVVPLELSFPANNTAFATTSFTVSGTTGAGNNVIASYLLGTATTTADASGNWALSFLLPEAAHQLSFVAEDDSGNTSATVIRNVWVDLTAPAAPIVSVDECGSSLNTDFCLLPTTTVNVSWNSVSDAAYYGLIKDGNTTATTTAATLPESIDDSATSTFAVVAYDAAGNAATSSSVSVRSVSRPLIINEIAWAGTDALSADEWVELKNISSYTLDLSRAALAATDGSPYIQLSGTLNAYVAGSPTDNGLSLIERRAEATGAPGQAVLFDELADSGEQLQLVWGSGTGTTTLDSTPDIATCGGWCGGSAAATIGFSMESGTTTARVSMERLNTHDGLLASNWGSNDTYARADSIPIKDADGVAVNGTPGKENSAQLPAAGWSCEGDAPLISGEMYAPSGDSCVYLSAFIGMSAYRYGDFYMGTVGSSTIINGHSLGKSISKPQSGDTVPAGTPLDQDFFIAIYETRLGAIYNDLAEFRTYFQTGGAPPHTNYTVIPWTFGP